MIFNFDDMNFFFNFFLKHETWPELDKRQADGIGRMKSQSQRPTDHLGPVGSVVRLNRLNRSAQLVGSVGLVDLLPNSGTDGIECWAGKFYWKENFRRSFFFLFFQIPDLFEIFC